MIKSPDAWHRGYIGLDILFYALENKCLKPDFKYEKSKKRYAEIKLFWRALEKIISDFCRERGFKRFALEKRIKELMAEWEPEKYFLEN